MRTFIQMFLQRIGDCMRVAFASMDNNRIDQHFGNARYWQIYDIDRDSTFIETRKVPVTYQGHHEDKFKLVLSVLNDCDAVFVIQIGESALEFMIRSNKRVFEATGEVLSIIRELLKGNLLA